jgi:hypothetical protein
MPKQPRGPLAIKRDAKPERVASRIVSSRPDLRQAGLFDLPPTWIAPSIPKLGPPTAPSGLNWLREISVIDQGNASIYARRGLNWTDRMPSIARKPPPTGFARWTVPIV